MLDNTKPSHVRFTVAIMRFLVHSTVHKFIQRQLKNLQLCSLTTVHVYHLGENQAYHSVHVLCMGMDSDHTDGYL